MNHKIIIPGTFYNSKRTFPGLNEYLSECSRNPHAGARIKKAYQNIACTFIKNQLRNLKIGKKIIIHYYFYEADKQRDKGNIFAFADKVIEDALQVCDIIPNDGWAQIENFTHEFYVDKKHPRIEIVLEEIEK